MFIVITIMGRPLSHRVLASTLYPEGTSASHPPVAIQSMIVITQLILLLILMITIINIIIILVIIIPGIVIIVILMLIMLMHNIKPGSASSRPKGPDRHHTSRSRCSQALTSGGLRSGGLATAPTCILHTMLVITKST